MTAEQTEMTLIDEILKSLAADAGISIEYFVVDGQGGYFQNIKRMTEFSQTKIVFLGARGGISIEGKNLSLGKYCGGDAVVRGEITKIERCGTGRNVEKTS